MTDSLFIGNDYRYSEAALLLSKEFDQAVRPIFAKAVDRGFNPREVAIIANDSTYMMDAWSRGRVRRDAAKPTHLNGDKAHG